MKAIKDNKFIEEVIYPRIEKRIGGTRSGIHASDTLACSRKVVLNKTAFESVTKEMGLRFMMGEAFALMMQSAVREVEAELDGIICTVDEIGVEYKSSRMSRNNLEQLEVISIEKLDKPFDDLSETGALRHYIQQVMAYCKVWKRKTFRLIVLSINGNYNSKKSAYFPPSYANDIDCYNLEFSAKELNDNWKYMTQRRDVIQKALDTGTLPGVEYRSYDKECETCPYLEKYCQVELLTKGMTTR